MKKLFIFFILVCVFAVSAFAQLNVGAYVKSYWIPYRLTYFPVDVGAHQAGDTAHTTAVQTPWGEPDISAGINFDGWSEWGGLHLGLDVANGAANRSAHAYSAKGSGWVWAKPFNFIKALGMDTFTIWLGNPVHEQLMGKIGGSDLATYVLNNSYSVHGQEGGGAEREFRLEVQNPSYNTFTRFNPYSWGNSNSFYQNLWWPRIAAAAMITWEPIENLWIGFFVAPEMLFLNTALSSPWNPSASGVNDPILISMNGDQMRGDDVDQDFYDVKEVYSKIQIGAGYDIPGIGYARLQWIGARNVLEAALQLKNLGDIMLDIGFKIPFEGTVKDEGNLYLMGQYKRRRDFQASVAATYRFYDFRLLGRIDTAFLGSNSYAIEVQQRGLDMIVYLVPSYQFSVGAVGLDIGFEYEQKDDFNAWEKDSAQAGFGLWFSRSMGNANFKAAMITRLPLEWEGQKQRLDFFFPIILQAGF
jgi:hypothetical protein